MGRRTQGGELSLPRTGLSNLPHAVGLSDLLGEPVDPVTCDGCESLRVDPVDPLATFELDANETGILEHP